MFNMGGSLGSLDAPGIAKAELVSRWGNGRPFPRGAVLIRFKWPLHNYTHSEVERSVVSFMLRKGYHQGVDYTIPTWNYSGIPGESRIREDFYLIFTSLEIYVMAKMQWDP